MSESEAEDRLIEACERLDPDAVRTSLQSNLNVDCRAADDNTPLLCAIDHVHQNPDAAIEIAELLLLSGANIESRGYMDKTPFLKACCRGNLAMLRLSVKHGCDINAVCGDVRPVSGIEFADIFNASREFKEYLHGLYPA